MTFVYTTEGQRIQTKMKEVELHMSTVAHIRHERHNLQLKWIFHFFLC